MAQSPGIFQVTYFPTLSDVFRIFNTVLALVAKEDAVKFQEISVQRIVLCDPVNGLVALPVSLASGPVLSCHFL